MTRSGLGVDWGRVDHIGHTDGIQEKMEGEVDRG